MITVPKIAELPFSVPADVVNAILDLRNFCESTQGIQEKWYNAPIDVYTIQWATDEFLKERKLSEWNKLPQGELAEKLESYALAKCWIIDNEYVTTIRSFLEKHFDTVFGFRIHILGPGQSIQDIAGHMWPRVFIPALNNDCKYTILDNDGIKHSMYYKVGHCYLWDVRLPHFVENQNNNLERVIATFMIDPDKESKLKI